ncbi:MAG: hypothetical protein ACUVT2_11920, partial [Thiobacillaceae bacterium]
LTFAQRMLSREAAAEATTQFRRRLTSAQPMLSERKLAAEANTTLSCNPPAKAFIQRFPCL